MSRRTNLFKRMRGQQADLNKLIPSHNVKSNGRTWIKRDHKPIPGRPSNIVGTQPMSVEKHSRLEALWKKWGG